MTSSHQVGTNWVKKQPCDEHRYGRVDKRWRRHRYEGVFQSGLKSTGLKSSGTNIPIHDHHRPDKNKKCHTGMLPCAILEHHCSALTQPKMTTTTYNITKIAFHPPKESYLGTTFVLLSFIQGGQFAFTR